MNDRTAVLKDVGSLITGIMDGRVFHFEGPRKLKVCVQTCLRDGKAICKHRYGVMAVYTRGGLE